MSGEAAADDRPLVLVVEDDPAIRELICEHLTALDVRLVAAGDGAAAIAAYCRHAPQAILIDLNRPGVDGFEFLRWLQTEPAATRAPAVVLTAHGDRASVQRAAGLGACGYVRKPFDGTDVRQRVRDLIARRLDPVLI
jgi:CheY-like chemotaxis protein